jgi:hypothetical protein
MAQASDGNWYAYFGDDSAVDAASAAHHAGTFNLNFGHDSDLKLGALTGAADVLLNATGAIQNPPTLSNYNNTVPGQTGVETDATAYFGIGQIGIVDADYSATAAFETNHKEWPFIQLYEFTVGDSFNIVLEQAGTDEIVELNYDTMEDYSGLELDRSSASQGSDVHLTITDYQLNIDPTAEDIVLFRPYGDSTETLVSWVNSTTAGAAGFAFRNYDNGFDDNGKLLITNATNGGDSILAAQATDDDAAANSLYVFYEDGENTGIFSNTDDGDNASLTVAEYAKRGFTATF